jgi:hypothetical protein
MRSELFGAFLLFFNGIFLDFSLLYSTLFHLSPLTSTVSTTALAVRRSNHSARSHPHIILFLYLFMCIRRTCSARKWRCGSNSERKLWTRFEFADFFLVWAASLFTLRTFGAQINWRIISRKLLFDPQRFLSNKSPIQFAGESEKGNMFLNGKRHVQNENGHRSPRSQTYAQQL